MHGSPRSFALSGTHVVSCARTGETASPTPHASFAPHGSASPQATHTVFGCRKPLTPGNGTGDVPTAHAPLTQPLASLHGAPSGAGPGSITGRPSQLRARCAPMFASCATPLPLFTS